MVIQVTNYENFTLISVMDWVGRGGTDLTQRI